MVVWGYGCMGTLLYGDMVVGPHDGVAGWLLGLIAPAQRHEKGS